MGVQEIKPSQVVGTEVKNIQRLKGRKREIDDKLEYFRLGELLQDILKGKYDKNTVEQDAHYIKGLQIEYEARYGKPAEEQEKDFGKEGRPANTQPSGASGTSKKTNKEPDSKTKNETNETKDTSTTEVKIKNKNSNNFNPNNEGVIINGDDNTVFEKE